MGTEKYELMVKLGDEHTTNSVAQIIDKIRKADHTSQTEYDSLSWWNEEKSAIEKLRQACVTSMNSFRTTLEYDEKELTRPELEGKPVRNAILARVGEKIVLDFYIRLSDFLLKKIAYFKQQITSEGNKGGWDSAYQWEYKRARTKFTEDNLIPDV